MRKTMAILASAAIALSLTACGSEPPVATCSEYAQLAPDTGLFTQMNDDQDALLRELLTANGKRNDDQNVLAAHLKIIAYCNIYDGRAGGNEDQPISNIF
jgi:predicted small lipoprotein YifL